MSLFLLSMTASCGKSYSYKDDAPVVLTGQPGDFISLTPANDAYAVLVNRSGMSGAEGRFHYHGNDKNDMFLGSSGQDLIFDIGHIERVGELRLWNYNEEGKRDSGVKDIKIYCSVDGINYAELKQFSLSEAAGISAEDSRTASEGVDLDAVAARYIKLALLSNHGGQGCGLSEIRLYRYKQEIKAGGYIAAIPHNPASVKAWNTAACTGLDDFFAVSAKLGNNAEHGYEFSEGQFILDLKGCYPVNEIQVWNYNASGNLGYGLKKIKVYSSLDGSVFRFVKDAAVEKGSGENGIAPSAVIALPECIQARYIKIEVLENYGGGLNGLGAVRCRIGGGWFADDVPDWTAMFSRYSNWAGADGIYAVNLDARDYYPERAEQDKKTFFIFSDTIMGEVDPVTERRGPYYMPNNTAAVLTGGKPVPQNITFTYPPYSVGSALIKPDPPEKAWGNGNKYYWMGDPFVANGKLYVFALKIDSFDKALDGMGFRQVGVDLARYDIKNGEVDFNSLKIIKDTSNALCDVSGDGKYYFGGAVFENTEANYTISPDGYYYIYGYYDKPGFSRRLVLARVKGNGIENLSKYEYLSADGKWVKNMDNPKFLAGHIAPEISVSQIRSGENRGKFLLVNTYDTTGERIVASIADTPWSEFTDMTTIFVHDTLKHLPGVPSFSYNAKAHPAISNKGELLISYNINGEDCFKHADIYRPRFIRLAQVPESE